ncbi:MAG: hypothetical protein Q9203_001877, partial [Teloschistes exilis]
MCRALLCVLTLASVSFARPEQQSTTRSLTVIGPFHGFPAEDLPLTTLSQTDTTLNLTFPLDPSQHSEIDQVIKTEPGIRPHGIELVAAISRRIYENWKDTANAPIDSNIHDRELPFRSFEFVTQPSRAHGTVLTPLKVGIVLCWVMQSVLEANYWPGVIHANIYDQRAQGQHTFQVGTLHIVNSPPRRLTSASLESSAISPKANAVSVGIPERVERRWLMCWTTLFFFALKFHLDQNVRDNLPGHRLPDKPTMIRFACGFPGGQSSTGDIISMELDPPRV